MTKEIIPPDSVISPKSHWALVRVLETNREGVAVAIGKWDYEPVLAIRWNGSKDNPIGNPQSRGLPTWFMLPDWTVEGILSELPDEAQTFARTFLDKPKV